MKTLIFISALTLFPFVASANSSLDENALFGFTCSTEFGEDSGLYAIDVGFVIRNGERNATIYAFGDGDVKPVGGIRLKAFKNGSFTTFVSADQKVYIKVNNYPDQLGQYNGFAQATSVSGLEYAVTCNPKKL